MRVATAASMSATPRCAAAAPRRPQPGPPARPLPRPSAKRRPDSAPTGAGEHIALRPLLLLPAGFAACAGQIRFQVSLLSLGSAGTLTAAGWSRHNDSSPFLVASGAQPHAPLPVDLSAATDDRHCRSEGTPLS